jgi:hypothetical protein
MTIREDIYLLPNGHSPMLEGIGLSAGGETIGSL